MPAYLKHKPTGDLYIASALLASRDDMIPIDAKEAGAIKGKATKEAKAREKVRADVDKAAAERAKKEADKKEAAKKEAANETK